MRLFLALPLPDELRSGLITSLERADLPRGRIVRSDLWHITLAFLDDMPDLDVEPLVNTCHGFTDGPGTITIDRLETFPHGNPRLFVASGIAEPRQDWSTFVEGLRSAMLEFAPAIDRKPWSQHITLGRSGKDELLPMWKASVGPWTWQPGGFSLMKSTLAEDGPTYESLHDFFFV